MTARIAIASALALILSAPAAMALTVTNNDDAAYALMVTMPDGSTQTLQVDAKGQATVDCAQGCEVALNEEKASVSPEMTTLAIEGGKFTQ